MTRYPLRVRLTGGRNTHAARPGGSGTHKKDRVTACDRFLPAYSDNHWLPDNEPVTCRRCARALDTTE